MKNGKSTYMMLIHSSDIGLSPRLIFQHELDSRHLLLLHHDKAELAGPEAIRILSEGIEVGVGVVIGYLLRA